MPLNASDDFFEREWRLAEQMRKMTGSLEPMLKLQQNFERERRNLDAVRKAVGDSSMRQQIDMLMSIERDAKQYRSVMENLNADSVTRHLRDFNEGLQRQKTIIDSLARIDVREFERMARLERELKPLLQASAFAADLKPVSSALHALDVLSVDADLQKWARQEESVYRIANASRFAAENARALGLDGISAIDLSSEFAIALQKRRKGSKKQGSSVSLLNFAVAFANDLSIRRPSLSSGVILQAVVLPLIITFIGIGVSTRLSNKSDDKLANRILTAISQADQPKRFVTTRACNLRSSPDKSATVLARLSRGTELVELDRDTRGWRYVRVIRSRSKATGKGWIYERNVQPK